MNAKNQTYEFICFTDLAYEFNISEKKTIESKIKRKLKYYNLGKYNQEIVDYLRNLKNDLYLEISKTTKSRYYRKSTSNFAELNDFDFEKMLENYSKKYERINENDMAGIINYAIYLYYMR